jgi:hypothetical protein
MSVDDVSMLVFWRECILIGSSVGFLANSVALSGSGSFISSLFDGGIYALVFVVFVLLSDISILPITKKFAINDTTAIVWRILSDINMIAMMMMNMKVISNFVVIFIY